MTRDTKRQEVSHTPGPWKATRTNWLGEPVEHDLYIHGNEHRSQGGNYATGIAIVCGNKTSHGVTDANARLIVLAPELLQACEEVLDYLESRPDSVWAGAIKGHFRALISKAKGLSS